jgi:hypothetical protein
MSERLGAPDPEWFFKQGRTLQRQQQFEEALQVLQVGINAYPVDGVLRLRIAKAQILSAMGRWEDAACEYRVLAEHMKRPAARRFYQKQLALMYRNSGRIPGVWSRNTAGSTSAHRRPQRSCCRFACESIGGIAVCWRKAIYQGTRVASIDPVRVFLLGLSAWDRQSETRSCQKSMMNRSSGDVESSITKKRRCVHAPSAMARK